jgi:hypothetical protein
MRVDSPCPNVSVRDYVEPSDDPLVVAIVGSEFKGGHTQVPELERSSTTERQRFVSPPRFVHTEQAWRAVDRAYVDKGFNNQPWFRVGSWNVTCALHFASSAILCLVPLFYPATQ